MVRSDFVDGVGILNIIQLLNNNNNVTKAKSIDVICYIANRDAMAFTVSEFQVRTIILKNRINIDESSIGTARDDIYFAVPPITASSVMDIDYLKRMCIVHCVRDRIRFFIIQCLFVLLRSTRLTVNRLIKIGCIKS